MLVYQRVMSLCRMSPLIVHVEKNMRNVWGLRPKFSGEMRCSNLTHGFVVQALGIWGIDLNWPSFDWQIGAVEAIFWGPQHASYRSLPKWLDQELTTGPPFEFLAEMAVICPCRPNFESRDFFQHSVTVCLRNLDGSYLACISSEMSLNFVVWLAALQGIHQIRLGFVGLCHSFWDKATGCYRP